MKEKLSIAKSIVLTASSLKLNGALIYSFDIKYIDSDQEFAFVKFNPKQKMYEINISRKMCEERDAKSLAFILVHEQSHPMLKHHTRCTPTMDHGLFNIAADHVINNPLRIDIDKGIIKGLTLPDDAVIIDSIKEDNMTMEEVYLYLKQHAKVEKQQIQFQINPDSNSSDSSNQDQENNQDQNQEDDKSEGEEGEENQKEENSENTITLEKLVVELPDGQKFELVRDIEPSKSDSEKEAEKEAEKKVSDQARRLLNSDLFKHTDKSKGYGRGNFMEMIEEELKVEISWEELLENVIKTNITEMSDNKTWSRINKRMYHYGMIAPYYEMEETYDTLYVVVDTSGSVSTTELMKFKNIIKESMHHFKKVIKIDHDSSIENISIFEVDGIDNMFETQPLGFSGRGGTSHLEVYQLIEKVYKEEVDYNDKNLEKIESYNPSLILFMTDLCSDIENYHHEYEWVKEIPYIYIGTDDSFQVDNIGKVIYIK